MTEAAFKRHWIGIAIIMGGAIALIVAAILYVRENTFTESALRAPGKIVEVVESSDTAKRVYYPVYTFRDEKGAEQKVQAMLGSSPPLWKVGDDVEILYEPGRPQDARINSFTKIWLVPAVVGFIGVTDLIVGAIIWVVLKK